MTITDNAHQTADDTYEPLIAKTIERADHRFGVIAARVSETRFEEGGRRYGVVFRRDVSDLCLEGSFSMSLGQDELMDLIAAASTAYHEINALRFVQTEKRDLPFAELDAQAGWEDDANDCFFPEQIDPYAGDWSSCTAGHSASA